MPLLTVRYLAKMQVRDPLCVAEVGQRAIEVPAGLDVVPALVLLDLHMPHRSGLEDVLGRLDPPLKVATTAREARSSA